MIEELNNLIGRRVRVVLLAALADATVYGILEKMDTMFDQDELVYCVVLSQEIMGPIDAVIAFRPEAVHSIKGTDIKVVGYYD